MVPLCDRPFEPRSVCPRAPEDDLPSDRGQPILPIRVVIDGRQVGGARRQGNGIRFPVLIRRRDGRFEARHIPSGTRKVGGLARRPAPEKKDHENLSTAPYPGAPSRYSTSARLRSDTIGHNRLRRSCGLGQATQTSASCFVGCMALLSTLAPSTALFAWRSNGLEYLPFAYTMRAIPSRHACWSKACHPM
jgi:hypothetical protein